MYDDNEGDEEDVTQSRVAAKDNRGLGCLISHLHATVSVVAAFLDTFPIPTTNDISLTFLGVKNVILT